MFITRRDAEVLKDRDLSGELKDIWGAVQAKREREKEPNYGHYLQNDIYIEFGPETSQERRGVQPSHDYANHQNAANDENLHQLANAALSLDDGVPPPPNHAPPPSYLDAILPPPATIDQMIDEALLQMSVTPPPAFPDVVPVNDTAVNAITTPKASLDANTQPPNDAGVKDVPLPHANSSNNSKTVQQQPQQEQPQPTLPSSAIEANGKPMDTIESATPTTIKQLHSSSASISITTNTNTTTPPPTTTTTKKEKVAGFLPNSCHNIFPFMKSKSNNDKNKHHNKDKEENQKNSKKSIKSTKEENLKNELANNDLNNRVHNKE